MTLEKHTQYKLILLNHELKFMEKAMNTLKFSYNRCLELGLKEQYSLEKEERFESLTSRFARLSDIIIQKIFRLIDRIELKTMALYETESTELKKINSLKTPLLFDCVERIIQHCKKYSI